MGCTQQSGQNSEVSILQSYRMRKGKSTILAVTGEEYISSSTWGGKHNSLSRGTFVESIMNAEH